MTRAPASPWSKPAANESGFDPAALHVKDDLIIRSPKGMLLRGLSSFQFHQSRMPRFSLINRRPLLRGRRARNREERDVRQTRVARESVKREIDHGVFEKRQHLRDHQAADNRDTQRALAIRIPARCRMLGVRPRTEPLAWSS